MNCINFSRFPALVFLLCIVLNCPVYGQDNYSRPLATDRPRVRIAGKNIVTGDTGKLLRGGPVDGSLANNEENRRWQRDPQTWIQEFRDNMHFNCMRIVCFDAWLYNQNGGGYSIDDMIVQYIDPFVDAASQAGMYAVINYHDVNISKYKPLDKRHNLEFWEKVAPRYRDRTHVIFEMVNEPGGDDVAQYTAYDLYPHFERVFEVMRNQAPATHVIFFSFPTYAWPLARHVRNFEQYLRDSPSTIRVDWNNESVGWHFYGDDAPEPLGRLRELRDNYPNICTEWSHHNSGNCCIPAVGGDRYNAQTLERWGVSWLDWESGKKRICTADHTETPCNYFHYGPEGLKADAVSKGYFWAKDLPGNEPIIKPQPPESPSEDFTIQSTDRAPVIDGNGDASWGAGRKKIRNSLIGRINGENDLEVQWTGLYDESCLYLLIEVSDDNLIADSGPLWYDDDGIEIFIDAENKKNPTYGEKDFHYVLRWGKRNILELNHNETKLLDAKLVRSPKGYTAEIKFPWASLGLIQEPRGELGFDIQVNDDDDGGGRDAKISYFSTRDNSYQNPGSFGTLKLGKPGRTRMHSSPRLSGAPQINGIILENEWKASFSPIAKRLIGAVDNPADLSGTWASHWDDHYLYLAVKVEDDKILHEAGDWWEDDGIEIFIDSDNRKGDTYGANDFQFVFRPLKHQILETHNKPVQKIKYAITEATNQGYTLEVAFPWSTLNLNPKLDRVIGIDVQINDDDDGGNRDAKYSWYANVDEAYLKPQVFGESKLNPEAGDRDKLKKKGFWAWLKKVFGKKSSK